MNLSYRSPDELNYVVELIHNVKQLHSLCCRRCRRDNDVAWSKFRRWLEYFGDKYSKLVIAVPPHYTSIKCSRCGNKVKN